MCSIHTYNPTVDINNESEEEKAEGDDIVNNDPKPPNEYKNNKNENYGEGKEGEETDDEENDDDDYDEDNDGCTAMANAQNH